MSGLRSDMSRIDRIYLAWGPDMSGHGNIAQRKSRSGAKTMCLGPDKVANSKLDNIGLREITGATRSNPNSRNQT
jgi:hypothetical protein